MRILHPLKLRLPNFYKVKLTGAPAAADRRGIGFGWLLLRPNAWLLHARLKIHRVGLTTGLWPTQEPGGPVH